MRYLFDQIENGSDNYHRVQWVDAIIRNDIKVKMK